jgi:hypothetical protein
MTRHCLLLYLFISIGNAQNVTAITEHSKLGANDSAFADVFPLSIGNQWVYQYDYESRGINPGMNDFSDTGTVNVKIINTEATLDSTHWILVENSNHWTNLNNIGWQGPKIESDTFAIVEINSGHHRLYRSTYSSSFNTPVFPFSPNLVDTARIYRYVEVDSTGFRSFLSQDYRHVPVYNFTFEKNVGLYSVSIGSGLTDYSFWWIEQKLRSSTITGITDHIRVPLPSKIKLCQNYPNPFNPSTTFAFDLPSRSIVSLIITDAIGREIATIVSRELDAGHYSLLWNASGLSSGIYFLRFQAASYFETKKLVLLR